MRRSSLARISEACLVDSISQFTTEGHLNTPVIWTVGRNRSFIAAPANEQGALLKEGPRTALTAVLICMSNALCWGEINEARVQRRSTSEPAPDAGDLWRDADTDPSIRTGIVVDAFAVRRRISYQARAVLDLSEHGQPIWTTAFAHDVDVPGRRLAPAIRALVDALSKVPGSAEDLDLTSFMPKIQELNWTAVEVDVWS